MTDISKAARKRMDSLTKGYHPGNAFARYIQEVSDAMRIVQEYIGRNSSGPVILVGLPNGESVTFADFILEDDVDPLLLKAREIAAKVLEDEGYPKLAAVVREGKADSNTVVQAALAALKSIETNDGK